jgi:hypothetical protein
VSATAKGQTIGRGSSTVKQIDRGLGRLMRRLAVTASMVVAMLAVTAPASWAVFGFESFQTSLEGPQAGQAGGHADFTTEFAINSHISEIGTRVSDADTRTFVADLPAGLLGNPNATPKCAQFDFNDRPLDPFSPEGGCPASTQVGVVAVTLSGTGAPITVPVFNMAPRHSGETAGLAFLVPLADFPVQIGLRVRTESDYGITARSDDLRHFIPIIRVKMTLWADPSDASHDAQRFPQAYGDGSLHCGVPCVPGIVDLNPNPGLPPRPYLTNPTRCGVPLTTHATAVAYGFPDSPATAESTLFAAGGLGGCDLVPFQPWLEVTPRSRAVDSPSGFDVEVSMPPSDDPDTPDQSHLRRAVVTLPEGVSINPSAAQGLVACTDDQLNIGTAGPAECPNASKVGSVEIESAPLPGDGKLIGHVYQRPQLPDETFRVVIVAEGHGVNAKIPGVIRPDASTGQITGLFDETPQVPFSKMSVRLDGGDRAVLVMPPRCGSHATSGVFTPWSGQPAVTRLVAFDTSWDGAGTACPAALPFDPSVEAGSREATAGAKAAFVVRVQRPDRNQELRAMTVKTPTGLAAYLRGVALCRSAEAAAGTCADASRIGTATSGAGAGSHPFYLGGKVFLTEGYKGAPYGMSIVVPAIAGPFNLGNVVVRAAIHVDRRTAALTVVSDQLPRILAGVPLRLRDIRVAIDRAGFAVNPTSCDPKTVVTSLESYGGASATRSSALRMDDCAALGFKPRLALRLTGAKQRRTGGHPGVRASVRQGGGQAGIERVQVTLPKALALDPDNAGALCEFADGTSANPEQRCPAGSKVGRAKAVSPLLNRPLVGDVFFVKNVRTNKRTGAQIRTLPMLVVALRGEIAINLRGTASVKRGRLVSTFAQVPDAPIRAFNLNLKGGNNGILAVTGSARGPLNLCAAKQTAEVDIDAHNGRSADRDITVRTPCKPVAKKTKKRR